MALEIDGRTIETDEEGYLLNTDDWDERVMEALAEREGITLTHVHRGLVKYFRDYYEDHMTHPSMRRLLLTKGAEHGHSFRDEKHYEHFLYELFPKGPIQEITKLAGLPKPRVEIED